MVRLDRITTRGGDGGETSLGSGRRVPKHHPRIEALGDIDEANSAIGLVRLHTVADPDADAMLARIQNDLFDLGADLCLPEAEQRRASALRLSANQTLRLEAESAAMNASLPPLKSFVLPGGTPAAAALHLARAILRRAERRLTALCAAEPLGAPVLPYINRLSDHLFILARRLNDGGKGDVLWRPGENR
ncbi:MAG: cob(I)yrinic acid a,c-diamide adenosyltransferase [Alphaproteobacteria bacterium]|nr:cob(I)yrinic acid a,c-diamide adenosyltransferase [Alphaproteobacteria bacterium]